jgi:hypothetical protein
MIIKGKHSLHSLALYFCLFTLAFLLVAALIMAGCGEKEASEDSGAVPRSEVTRYGEGYRFTENGWIYMHIEGEPYERGKQQGYLVAGELQEIKRSLEYLTYQNTGMQWSFFVDAAAQMFAPMMSEEFLDEIKGIADGAQEAGTDIAWQEILAWNGYTELTSYWWPNEQQKVYETMPSNIDQSHCSAFMAIGSATADGRLVMAHNSWDQFETGQFMNLILDILPNQGHRIFMQSMPGYIHSMADFFVTDAGLAGTETTIGGFSLYKTGESPEFYRMREAIQYSNNLDDFVKYMEDHNNGGYANTWLVADLNVNEMMQFELGLKFANVEKKKDGYFIGANYPHDPRIRNLECDNSGYCDIRRHQGAREVRLTELMEEYNGRIDVEIGQQILADHYDVYLEESDNPCSRTIDGHYELDAREYMSQADRPKPYQPRGTVDGKVADAEMAENLSFVARWGNSSGMPFDAQEFLDEHIQWNYLQGYLKDRPTRPWTVFKAGE